MGRGPLRTSLPFGGLQGLTGVGSGALGRGPYFRDSHWWPLGLSRGGYGGWGRRCFGGTLRHTVGLVGGRRPADDGETRTLKPQGGLPRLQFPARDSGTFGHQPQGHQHDRQRQEELHGARVERSAGRDGAGGRRMTLVPSPTPPPPPPPDSSLSPKPPPLTPRPPYPPPAPYSLGVAMGAMPRGHPAPTLDGASRRDPRSGPGATGALLSTRGRGGAGRRSPPPLSLP